MVHLRGLLNYGRPHLDAEGVKNLLNPPEAVNGKELTKEWLSNFADYIFLVEENLLWSIASRRYEDLAEQREGLYHIERVLSAHLYDINGDPEILESLGDWPASHAYFLFGYVNACMDLLDRAIDRSISRYVIARVARTPKMLAVLESMDRAAELYDEIPQSQLRSETSISMYTLDWMERRDLVRSCYFGRRRVYIFGPKGKAILEAVRSGEGQPEAKAA